jgi:hypothetical protein
MNIITQLEALSARNIDEKKPEFDYSSPLNFLLSVFRNEEVPLHTRLRAASEACKYSTPQLKAVAHVTANDPDQQTRSDEASN